jgi:hypothetical protein
LKVRGLFLVLALVLVVSSSFPVGWADQQTIPSTVATRTASLDIKVVLVGDEDQVSKELSRYPTSKLPIYIHHAPLAVAMHDSPSVVLLRMKDTSIKVALDLANEGQVRGVVSAGNSGAAMGLAMYIFKKFSTSFLLQFSVGRLLLCLGVGSGVGHVKGRVSRTQETRVFGLEFNPRPLQPEGLPLPRVGRDPDGRHEVDNVSVRRR